MLSRMRRLGFLDNRFATYSVPVGFTKYGRTKVALAVRCLFVGYKYELMQSIQHYLQREPSPKPMARKLIATHWDITHVTHLIYNTRPATEAVLRSLV